MELNGCFIVSLDFELHWGVFDKKSVRDYQENLEHVKIVIPRLLELAKKYNIKLTFATVGFLFAKNKEELFKHHPKIKPTYKNTALSSYSIMKEIGDNELEDQYHYASSLIDEIKKHNSHEITTHTYSHYYCLEPGQTKEQFDEDLKSAIQIAEKQNIDIKTIVFPRNQTNKDYLTTCYNNGLVAYRGVENSRMYNTANQVFYKRKTTRLLRFFDAYLNLSGYHVYGITELKKQDGIFNIPSSRFLRPYNNLFQFIDNWRIKRVKKAMTLAAKQNKMYHLWWHPHNFGKHIEENFNALEKIFVHYQSLNKTYNFDNQTMLGFYDQYLNTKAEKTIISAS